MHKILKEYFNSFRPNKLWGKTLLADVLAVAMIIFLIFSLSSILSQKSASVLKGKSLEEISQLQIKATAEEKEAYLEQIGPIISYFIFGGIFVALAALLILSFSNAYIWNILTNQKFQLRKYWGWIGLNIVILIPCFLFFLAYFAVKLVFKKLASGNIEFVGGYLIDKIFLLSLIVFCFLAFYHFAREYKTGASLGQTFSRLRKDWKLLGTIFILSLAVYLLVDLVLYFLSLKFFQKEYSVVVAGIILALLFNCWLRIYLVRNLAEISSPAQKPL